MAKCWLATWAGRSALPALTGGAYLHHPSKCAFCEMPRDLLVQMLEEFRDWAGISPLTTNMNIKDVDESMRLEIESFLTLPAREQERLVAKQQYEDDREW